MVDDKPPLGHAVESDRLQDQAFAEAVVEEPRAGADYGLGWFSAPRSWRPCEAEPRRHVGPIVKMVLDLVAQTRAEGQTRAHPPIVLDIDSRFRLRHSALGLAARNRKLGSATTPGADCRGSKSQLLQQQSAPVTLQGRNRRQDRVS